MNWIDIYSQKWANEAFLLIKNAGLTVTDFQRERHQPSIRIIHLPTKEYFVFGDEKGGAYWTRPGYSGQVSQTGVGPGTLSAGWDKKLVFFAIG